MTPVNLRQLIREMRVANPAPRFHAELLKLGIDVGQTTAVSADSSLWKMNGLQTKWKTKRGSQYQTGSAPRSGRPLMTAIRAHPFRLRDAG